MKTRGWKTFFERLKGSVYLELVEDFWIHAFISLGGYIFSKVLGKDICISKKDIAKLLQRDGEGVMCFGYACAIEKASRIAHAQKMLVLSSF